MGGIRHQLAQKPRPRRGFLIKLMNMGKRGFTLVELLVVIAIIGLLSTVAVVSMNGARVKARDAKRLSDVRQVQSALEVFYSVNDYYPRYDGGGSVACGGAWAVNANVYKPCWDDLASKLSPYMRLPDDPKNPATDLDYQYETLKSGQGYIFMMLPENASLGGGDGCYGGWYCKAVNWP
jgi:prepilin-type N-terminal cleavage/methylation domain-containing protein